MPVLLNEIMVRSIDCLINCRNLVGIDERNPFVFPRISGINSANGFSCLKRRVERADLEGPELVRSTKLRKYIATVSQILDMTPSEISVLCAHMEHSLTVHENYYRLLSQTLELAKISKLLIALEGGCLASLCGKSLDQLDISDIPDDLHILENEPTISRKRPNVEHVETVFYGSSDDDESEIPCSANRGKRSRQKLNNSVTSLSCNRRISKSVEQKRPWSIAEKEALHANLRDSITKGVVLGKRACIQAIEQSEGILANRSWQHVKFAAKNIISSSKRMLKK